MKIDMVNDSEIQINKNARWMAIYIHIPFCVSKCRYCDFYSVPAESYCMHNSYISALINQIKNQALQYKDYKIKTVYIGGGTPSLLSSSEFLRLFRAIRQSFNLSECLEITVECNPESTYIELLKTLKVCGVNRISMGVQSFDDRELIFLGRPHNSNDIYKAYQRIVASGFDNINLDLIIAISNQTVKSLEHNINEICRLNPTHISAYILKIEENTPLGKLFIKDLEEEIIEKMYLMTSEAFTKAGYEHYEVSNFSKPGFRSKHNMNYWQDGEYLAFGAGAYGYVDGIRYRYSSDFKDFIYKKGIVDRIIEEKITEDEKIREKIMLSLRLSDGLSKEFVKKPEDKAFFERLINQELAIEKPEAYALTPKGFLVSNSIINQILN